MSRSATGVFGTALAQHLEAIAAAPEIGDPARAEQVPQGPNILWICTDQQRWDTIHALGNRHIRTPNLDRLANMGVAFTHTYCQSPICTPSRASFLTGMYPSTVHACLNGNRRWAEAAPLVTKTLADGGYFCGLAGKLHLSSAHGRVEPRPDEDGYEAFYWSHHPADDWPIGHAYADWLHEQGLDFDDLMRQHGSIPEQWHQTTWCTDMTIRFLKNRANPVGKGQPWLFSLNCFDPHPPYNPPKNYLDRFDVAGLPGPQFRESDLAFQQQLAAINFQSIGNHPDKANSKLVQAKYWAMIELIDKNVGRLLDALEATKQLDNTVIVFMSDHGDTIGDHGLMMKGCRFYEGLVRVPLLVAWPGKFKAGVRSDALVELTDLAPTLLDIAGLPVSEKMMGRSLLPILTSQKPTGNHREAVRSEYYQTLEGAPSYATMLRDRRYKLVHYHGFPVGELYDLQTDPHEFVNLWNDPKHADLRFEMTRKNFDALAFAVDIGSDRIGRY